MTQNRIAKRKILSVKICNLFMSILFLQDSANRLLERLQQIDGRLTKYFDIVYRSSLTRKRNDILEEETHIAGKRQASSGKHLNFKAIYFLYLELLTKFNDCLSLCVMDIIHFVPLQNTNQILNRPSPSSLRCQTCSQKLQKVSYRSFS